MAPKTGAPCGKKKKTQVAATKNMEKKNSCRRLTNPVLSTLGRSLAPGSCRKKQVSRSVKAGLHFPVGWIRRYLKEGRYSKCIGFGAPVYLMAILEYLTAEVLELAGQAAKDNKKIYIIPRHVMLDVMRDEDLSKLPAGVTITHSGMLPNMQESLLGNDTAEGVAKWPAEDAAKSPEKTAVYP